jgi:hypothetical protein
MSPKLQQMMKLGAKQQMMKLGAKQHMMKLGATTDDEARS